MVDASLISFFMKLVPDIAEAARETSFDISKAKKDDLILLCLIDHHKSSRKQNDTIIDKLEIIEKKVNRL